MSVLHYNYPYGALPALPPAPCGRFFCYETKLSHVFVNLNPFNHLLVEVFGYHNRGDPWKEERYSGD